MKAKFLQSASEASQIPYWGRPEVALVGRSNSGKSSLVNALCGQALARVSQTPGKTRLMNFFEVTTGWTLVDLPGYGFAQRSKKEQESWGQMIEAYLHQREDLVGLLLLIDGRRSWSEDESLLYQWAKKNHVKMAVVVTKSDKLNQKQRHSSEKSLREGVGPELPIYFISATKKRGLEELANFIYHEWVRRKEPH